MASLHTTWLYQDKGLKCGVSAYNHASGKPCVSHLQSQFLGSFPSGKLHVQIGFNAFRKACLLPCAKSEKKNEDIEHVYVERPPYYSYLDSTSGQPEPASGARASIPGEDYWPEGTSDRVRAARAPPPTGVSEGSPSFGKNPGSRRKKYKTSAATPESSEASIEFDDLEQPENVEETAEEPKDVSSDYVIYQTESEEETLTDWELDKKLGRPHPFFDPNKKKPIGPKLTNDELWWKWRKPEKGLWSRWQRRKPDVETVFLKAMAETGQVKLHGDHPTLTEVALYRARKRLFKEERLQAEKERLEKDGPIAYYSEWVKAWKKDTSREAIQKYFEETGEDENTQLIEMFCQQTDREFRVMMGTDIRIRRDPLAMRLREDQIKQIWGGDPVYPTINYIQDPNEIVDYRAPDFHEPTPTMLDYLKEHGKIITREELDVILAKEKAEQVETTDIDEAMAKAVDIGDENDDDGEDGEVDGDEIAEDEERDDDGEEDDDDDNDNDDNDNDDNNYDDDGGDDGGGDNDGGDVEEEETITRNWSVYKTTPQPRKSKKSKPKKDGSMTLKEAIDDSENLTDFLMDFDEEE